MSEFLLYWYIYSCLMTLTPQKLKGPQTPTSHCSSGSLSKQQATISISSRSQFGTSGVSGSRQWGDSSSSIVSKFRPNSKAELGFNHSFKSRLVFVSRGVILDKFSVTFFSTYFTKWGWKHLNVSDGVVCLELVWEFFANIHSSIRMKGH